MVGEGGGLITIRNYFTYILVLAAVLITCLQRSLLSMLIVLTGLWNLTVVIFFQDGAEEQRLALQTRADGPPDQPVAITRRLGRQRGCLGHAAVQAERGGAVGGVRKTRSASDFPKQSGRVTASWMGAEEWQWNVVWTEDSECSIRNTKSLSLSCRAQTVAAPPNGVPLAFSNNNVCIMI